MYGISLYFIMWKNKEFIHVSYAEKQVLKMKKNNCSTHPDARQAESMDICSS